MSRSNGSATQPGTHQGSQAGAWPQQRPGAPAAGYETDPQAWTAAQAAGHNAGQPGRWPPQTAAAPSGQGYAPPPQGAHPGYGAPPEPLRAPAQAYHYPQGAEGHDPYSRPTLGGRETTGAPAAHGYPPPSPPSFAQPAAASYSPQFDPYTPPGAPAAGGYGHGGQPDFAHHGAPQYSAAQYAAPQYKAPHYEPAPAQDYGRNELSSLQRPAPEPFPAPELRGPHYDQGYDQWSQQGYQPPQQPALDPRGYDAGGYAPAPAGYPPQPSLEPAHSEWGGADTQFGSYAQPQGYPQHAGPQHGGAATGYDRGGEHAGHAGLAPSQGGQLEPAYQHEDGGDYEIEEPPAGRRWGLIAAALVGAIALGGGLAYGYKKFLGPAATTATAPVVKNNGVPTKVKPAEPGGKQFAHTDSKIMGRLNDQGAGTATSAAATSGDSDNGARKVQTMVVGRDGSIVPPAPSAPVAAPSAPAPSAGGPQPVTVPGMTIVDGFGGRPPAAALAGAGAPAPSVAPSAARPVVVNPPAPAAAPVAAAPARPMVVAKAAVPVTANDATAAPVTSTAKPAAPKVAVPKKAAAPAAAAGPTGGNGFVAVLASVPASSKSNMDALKQFADMQQKYGTALANKTPEVREANLGDKGTYHRLLVGPPGSREQAGQLCSQLKAAGYGSCWVTAY